MMNYFILIIIFIFGLIVGSFLNSVIWRLHKEEGILSKVFGGRSKNRSYCIKCRKQIYWYDNIPLLSFILLRGKCRHCKKAISWQYPAVELATGILFVITFIVNLESGITNQGLIVLIRNFLVISIMIVIFVYDLRWYLILDIVTIPAIILFFIINLFLGFDLWNLLLSGIIGGSFFLFQFIISKGKWIGGGDIRLGVLMGVILRWPSITN